MSIAHACWQPWKRVNLKQKSQQRNNFKQIQLALCFIPLQFVHPAPSWTPVIHARIVQRVNGTICSTKLPARTAPEEEPTKTSQLTNVVSTIPTTIDLSTVKWSTRGKFVMCVGQSRNHRLIIFLSEKQCCNWYWWVKFANVIPLNWLRLLSFSWKTWNRNIFANQTIYKLFLQLFTKYKVLFFFLLFSNYFLLKLIIIFRFYALTF